MGARANARELLSQGKLSRPRPPMQVLNVTKATLPLGSQPPPPRPPPPQQPRHRHSTAPHLSGKPKDRPEKTLSNQLLEGATPPPKDVVWL